MKLPDMESTVTAAKTSDISLREQIAQKPEAQVRELYALTLEDWADTDTKVREVALRVLTDFEVNGDSYGVPCIADIVDTLVKKIEART